MDKREFLSGLERALSILQEDELRDIVSEYEQHIDMKVEKGLTEEEAIADFGSFEELTGEILEAYHVRADYAAGSGRQKARGEKRPAKSGQEFFGRLKSAKKDFSMKEKTQRLGKGIRQGISWGRHQLCRPFVWIKRVQKDRERRPRLIQKRKEGRMMTRLMDIGLAVILWGIRMVWNGCWFLFSLFMIAVGLFSLYGLGVLAILLMQGYPLTGVLLGCLGLVLCTFSAAGLGISFLWRRKGLENPEVVKEAEEGC